MTRLEWLKMEIVMRQASKIARDLEELNAADLQMVIATREHHQNDELFAAMPEGPAKKAGVALTQTLKLIAFFREEILRTRPTVADQAAAVEHAKNYFAQHPERWGGK